MQNYQKEVNAYSRGEGRLTLTLGGYKPCHNTEEVCERYAELDGLFYEAALASGAAALSADGVHPTPDGACYIGEAYLKAVTPLIEAALCEGDFDTSNDL